MIRLVNLVIQRAVELRASDIHIEPFENRLKVRYRVDGVLIEGESPPANLTAAVISRIKIMARLNIAERRLPQDGRIMLRVAGRRHWYAGVIHHTGRQTGKSYATPVVVEQSPDGIVIPLPYGADVDWLRNAIAAGHATVTVHGETFDDVVEAYRARVSG